VIVQVNSRNEQRGHGEDPGAMVFTSAPQAFAALLWRPVQNVFIVGPSFQVIHLKNGMNC
jgi:hypothetical protein